MQIFRSRRPRFRRRSMKPDYKYNLAELSVGETTVIKCRKEYMEERYTRISSMIEILQKRHSITLSIHLTPEGVEVQRLA